MNNNKLNENGGEIRVYFKKSKKDMKQEANIFIRNINTNSTKELEELVSQYGKVLSSKIKKHDNQKSLGYGYVQFETRDDAQKAVEELNGKVVWGKKLEVDFFKSQKERGNTLNVIYIRNFPKEWKEEEIKKYVTENFEKFGKILEQNVWFTNRPNT